MKFKNPESIPKGDPVFFLSQSAIEELEDMGYEIPEKFWGMWIVASGYIPVAGEGIEANLFSRSVFYLTERRINERWTGDGIEDGP